MKILLLTRNHVVREFIELVSDRISAQLEVKEDTKNCDETMYDFLFVDDRGDLLEQSIPLLENANYTKSVILYNEIKEAHALFDFAVKKPFLPSDIQAILEKHALPEEPIQENKILDLQEIEEIKRLLEGEMMEIIPEEDLAAAVISSQQKEPLQTSVTFDTKEEIAEALMHMEPKKLRKLLKGAEVTINIRFPKESE